MTVAVPPDVETAHPVDIIRWAAADVPLDRIVVTASFEDAVLVHAAHTALPGVRIALLDTGYLFAETWWLAETMQRRFGINLDIVTPLADVPRDDRWQHDTEGCCAARKVEPLQRALTGAAVWITGIRRVDGPTRASAPIASVDPVRNVLKVNPLAAWSDDDMALYAQLHDLPANPLTARGYPSIGCWPCTRPVAPGEDKRAGRWSGQAKTECGLHV